jgi:hypothetical protein
MVAVEPTRLGRGRRFGFRSGPRKGVASAVEADQCVALLDLDERDPFRPASIDARARSTGAGASDNSHACRASAGIGPSRPRRAGVVRRPPSRPSSVRRRRRAQFSGKSVKSNVALKYQRMAPTSSVTYDSPRYLRRKFPGATVVEGANAATCLSGVPDRLRRHRLAAELRRIRRRVLGMKTSFLPERCGPSAQVSTQPGQLQSTLLEG